MSRGDCCGILRAALGGGGGKSNYGQKEILVPRWAAVQFRVTLDKPTQGKWPEQAGDRCRQHFPRAWKSRTVGAQVCLARTQSMPRAPAFFLSPSLPFSFHLLLSRIPLSPPTSTADPRNSEEIPRPGALLPTSRPLRGFPGAPSLQCLRTGGCHGLPDTAAEMWSPMSRRDSDLKVELIVSQSVLFVGNLSRPHILENNFKTSVKFGHLFWNRRTVVPGRCVNDQVTQLRPGAWQGGAWQGGVWLCGPNSLRCKLPLILPSVQRKFGRGRGWQFRAMSRAATPAHPSPKPAPESQF